MNFLKKIRFNSAGRDYSILTAHVTLDATTIVGTSAGDIGHANGATIVAAPPEGFVLEYVSSMLIYKFGTAAYTGGGDDLVLCMGGGGSAVTQAVANANLLGAAGNKIVLPVPPDGVAGIAIDAGVGISLRGTAYTQPGTAAGTLLCHVLYRIHETGF